MRHMTRSVLQGGINAGFLEVRKIFQNLFGDHPARQHFEHMAHCDAHAATRRFTAADARLDRNPLAAHTRIFMQHGRKAIGLARLNNSGSDRTMHRYTAVTESLSWSSKKMPRFSHLLW